MSEHRQAEVERSARGTVLQGRWTHRRHGGGLVIFLIGMRVNRLAAVRTWGPVAAAMPRMVRELYAQPELGFLGHVSTLHGRGAMTVQYWRDLESLQAYAAATDHEHRPAWREFNRRARAAQGAVGIWHETYVVPAGGDESVHVAMPVQGVLKALGAVQVNAQTDSLQQRISRPATRVCDGASAGLTAPAHPS